MKLIRDGREVALAKVEQDFVVLAERCELAGGPAVIVDSDSQKRAVTIRDVVPFDERVRVYEREQDMVSSPVKCHGGKGAFQGKLAKWIVSLMPDRDGSWNRYVEPYFGSGAVMFAMDPEGLSEFANDLDSCLTNFWLCLKGKPSADELIKRLTMTPLSEAEFSEATQPYDHNDPVDCAVAFFVRNRQSRQSLGKFYVTPTARIRRGMNEQVSAWLSAVDGLPEAVERLRRVEIWCRPALEVIESLDSESTVFYCDPPYLQGTRSAKSAYGDYEMSQYDHTQLLLALAESKGRFLLSGYRSDLYDDFAKKCSWSRHETQSILNSSSKPSKDTKVECVWTNY